MKNKRGQESGAGVAVLLLLIALFMILYILLLPPEERENILNQSIPKEGGTSEEVTPSVLLSENPGEVFPTKESDIVHDISPINIFIKTEPTTRLLANTLEISRGLFSSKPQILTFPIEDLTNIKSAILFFSVKEAKGNLEIWLNNHIIEDSKLEGAQTIDLPVNYLKKDNTLELKASNPGILFFMKNYYNLESIGIKESYEKINPKEDRSFSVPEYEKNSLQKSTLKYQIYCNKLDKETDFRIYLNDKDVLSKIVSCIAGSEELDLPIEKISKGTNKLTFMIGDGDFQISQIKVEDELKEKSNPVYHFDVDESNYDDVSGDLAHVIVHLKLAGTNKKAEIIINNKQFSIDTNDNEYSKDISEFINEGDNFIKIVPKNTFTIDLLEVKVQ